MATPQREVLKLRLANGALLDAPIYEGAVRGINYLAVIDVDPTMPGGLARRFAQKGRGECLYLTEKLDLFDPVEFAADYTTTTGNKHRLRWYGVLIAKTEDYLLIERCSTGATAVLRAKQARMSPGDRKRALEAERDSVIARAAVIEQEIAQLEVEQGAKNPQLNDEQVSALRAAINSALSLALRPNFGHLKYLFDGIEVQYADGNYKVVVETLIDFGKKRAHPLPFWLAIGEARALIAGETPEQNELRTNLKQLIDTANLGNRGKTRTMVAVAAEYYAEGDFVAVQAKLRHINIIRKQAPEWCEALSKLEAVPTAQDGVLQGGLDRPHDA